MGGLCCPDKVTDKEKQSEINPSSKKLKKRSKEEAIKDLDDEEKRKAILEIIKHNLPGSSSVSIKDDYIIYSLRQESMKDWSENLKTAVLHTQKL